MKLFKTKQEKIFELEAKIEAWKETWGSVKGPISSYELDRVEGYIAKLYELRKLSKSSSNKREE